MEEQWMVLLGFASFKGLGSGVVEKRKQSWNNQGRSASSASSCFGII
jgi:hypothetical protein